MQFQHGVASLVYERPPVDRWDYERERLNPLPTEAQEWGRKVGTPKSKRLVPACHQSDLQQRLMTLAGDVNAQQSHQKLFLQMGSGDVGSEGPTAMLGEEELVPPSPEDSAASVVQGLIRGATHQRNSRAC
jgi:hypothetical protein